MIRPVGVLSSQLWERCWNVEETYCCHSLPQRAAEDRSDKLCMDDIGSPQAPNEVVENHERASDQAREYSENVHCEIAEPALAQQFWHGS